MLEGQGHRSKFKITRRTSAQQQLRWATVPAQSGSKKWGGAAVSLSPSNTTSPGPRPT